jgi:hypothetical protein
MEPADNVNLSPALEWFSWEVTLSPRPESATPSVHPRRHFVLTFPARPLIGLYTIIMEMSMKKMVVRGCGTL